jgi:integrase
LDAFTEYVDRAPEQLILEAENEIQNNVTPRMRNIKKHLTGFRKYIQDKGLAPCTVQVHMSAVRSFYKTFDIEIPNLPNTGNRAKPLEKHKNIPTKEDLQAVLKVCGPLERAVLLVGVSSGLSANEIQNLKNRDFKNGYDQKTEVTTLNLRRGKVKVDFTTFTTPEASRAVWDYLEYRARKPKFRNRQKIETFEKQEITSDDGYLFVMRSVSDKFLIDRNEEIRKLNSTVIIKLYRKLSEDVGKNTPSGDWNLIRSHTMRKFFCSAMLNAGADSFFIEFLMAHTLDSTRAAYFRASPEKLKEIYLKFIPSLTIQTLTLP